MEGHQRGICMSPRPLNELVSPDWAEALQPVAGTITAMGRFLRAELAAGRSVNVDGASGQLDFDLHGEASSPVELWQVEAAGFKFEGESKALDNPSDDHTKNVFDPAIRGKTDQFALRFVKPA